MTEKMMEEFEVAKKAMGHKKNSLMHLVSEEGL